MDVRIDVIDDDVRVEISGGYGAGDAEPLAEWLMTDPDLQRAVRAMHRQSIPGPTTGSPPVLLVMTSRSGLEQGITALGEALQKWFQTRPDEANLRVTISDRVQAILTAGNATTELTQFARGMTHASRTATETGSRSRRSHLSFRGEKRQSETRSAGSSHKETVWTIGSFNYSSSSEEEIHPQGWTGDTERFPITIFLSNETIHVRVEDTLEALLAYAGFEIVERDDPIFGSWFRRMRAERKESESRTDPAITANILRDLGPFIATLQPTKDAVVRMREILIVKIDWTLMVYELTPGQQRNLDEDPTLARSPREILGRLGISETATIALSPERHSLPSAGGGRVSIRESSSGLDAMALLLPGGGSNSAQRRSYLRGQCPEAVVVGQRFSLIVSIARTATGNAERVPFRVSSQGRDVALTLDAPRLRILGDQELTVHAPADSDSSPARFELLADAPGQQSMSVLAWADGAYLGELRVDITADWDHAVGPQRQVVAEIAAMEHGEGAVSLVVRYDSRQNTYRFEFRDVDNPDEVPHTLMFDPKHQVEHLLADLDDIAKGRSRYSRSQTQDYLVNAGVQLWRELIPPQLREQFWDRRHRIRQLTILAKNDTVPWELLYPRDPGHDAGFLIEQFPVIRGIFGRPPIASLSLRPARFVLPDGSPPEARAEVDAMRNLLDPAQLPDAAISTVTSLQEVIHRGDFGLLHFACHNRFHAADGSSIKLGNAQFTPKLMATAAAENVLKAAAPIVFMNACRSAGHAATYNRLDGWAVKFLEAGAAAFIGSLWAVTDETSRLFAEAFYTKVMRGANLGDAVTHARREAAKQLDDPTWLAYTVYGNPRATLRQATATTASGEAAAS